VDLFFLVGGPFTEDSSHSILFVKFHLNLDLLLVLLLMRVLVSKLVLVCLLPFFIPIFRLASGATELVMVPVMLEAGLGSSLELFEGAVLCSLFVLRKHVG
jgi:hypothetical protein